MLQNKKIEIALICLSDYFPLSIPTKGPLNPVVKTITGMFLVPYRSEKHAD